jgi:hypothetical protein
MRRQYKRIDLHIDLHTKDSAEIIFIHNSLMKINRCGCTRYLVTMSHLALRPL